MVYTELDIVNLALGRIGQPPIVSFDDDSLEARLASSAYPMMRDSLQRRYRWNFCKGRVVLSPLTETLPFGGFRAFARPSDYIAALGAYEGTWGNEGSYSGQVDLLRVEGDKILWPGQTLNLYYQKRVVQESFFDPLFSDALAWSLAREFALSLANDAKKAQLAEDMFTRTIRQARVANAMETAPEVIQASEWLNGRWSRAFGYREWNHHSAEGVAKEPFPATAPTPDNDLDLEID